MELRAMPAHVTSRRWSVSRAFAQALLLSLIPLGTASAQPAQMPPGYVRVTHDKTKIECFAKKIATCMTAPKGTVLEVLYIEGDRYNHRNSNRYWILLPEDRWGRRVTGWIRGNAIEHVAPPPAPAMKATVAEAPRDVDARHEPANTPMPAPAPVENVPAARTIMPDVVVHFEFGKSALTAEARRILDGAIARPTSSGPSLTIEIEGHADWIGSTAYNDRLGLARAETVKRYMTEHLGFPPQGLSVVSYGEREPVAPNTTREGRAQNRRVVIKSGS
jgi:outer membrane protein OmpA-like peptidoglycan-associated protein